MSKVLRAVLVVTFLAGLVGPEVFASGGSSQPPPSTPRGPTVPAAPPKSPAEQAVDHYNAGLRYRDRALKFSQEARESTEEKKKAKLEQKAGKELERAISEFRLATEKNPRFHEAFSDLGFALRKTGDYPAALEAYDRALSLAPGYPNAIEYRGEAFLGLDRVEEAKQAYLSLFGSHRGQADELLAAMKEWVSTRKAVPGQMSPDAVEQFARWVEEREEIARQTPSLSELPQRKW